MSIHSFLVLLKQEFNKTKIVLFVVTSIIKQIFSNKMLVLQAMCCRVRVQPEMIAKHYRHRHCKL